MSKITGAGSTATPAAVLEQPAPSSQIPQASNEPASQTQTPQDPKDKVGGLKLEGQIREAQVRSQFEASPQFKMPGVDFHGPALNDPKITEGFKEFDKPMPSVEMKWPEKGDWKETEKDGKIHREMTDAGGTKYQETIGKDGTRERETSDKEGNRRMEITQPDGYVLRGGADKNGNSWTTDSKGVTTRMHPDASGKLFSEIKAEDGSRTRRLMDRQGYEFKETLDKMGKIERESTDTKGNRQMEIKEPNGFWMKGFADSKGNSYTIDSNGTSTRMHQDSEDGKTYAETSSKDGSRTRRIMDKQGSISTEEKAPNGQITRSNQKIE